MPKSKSSRQTFLTRMQQSLTAERAELQQRITDSQSYQTIDHSGDDTDAIQARILALGVAEIGSRNRSNLAKLDTALRKISEGTFGVCEECDEEIGEKRLEANPGCLLCILCAEQLERTARGMGR